MVWEGAKHCGCIASIFPLFSSSNTMVTAQISSPLTDNGLERENRSWETCLQSKLSRLLPKDPLLCHPHNYLLLTGSNVPCHHSYIQEWSKVRFWIFLFSKIEVELWSAIVVVVMCNSIRFIVQQQHFWSAAYKTTFLPNNLYFSMLLPGAFWKTDYKTVFWHG